GILVIERTRRLIMFSQEALLRSLISDFADRLYKINKEIQQTINRGQTDPGGSEDQAYCRLRVQEKTLLEVIDHLDKVLRDKQQKEERRSEEHTSELQSRE